MTQNIHQFKYVLKPTCASLSISLVSFITDTSEGPRCVGTHSILTTRWLFLAFINIWTGSKYVHKILYWRQNNTRSYKYFLLGIKSVYTPGQVHGLYCIGVLTCASHPVSTVSITTGTSEGPRCVGAHSISITGSGQTFVDIYNSERIDMFKQISPGYHKST